VKAGAARFAAPLRLLARFERVIRYVLVGAAMAGLYAGLTTWLFKGGFISDPTLASAIASVISLPVSFLVHRRITYADVIGDREQWRRFAFIAATNFILSTGLMKLIDHFHQPFWIAILLGFILVPCANYAINGLWVFRTRRFWELDKPRAPASLSERPQG
jgi:putative flippase GtrA